MPLVNSSSIAERKHVACEDGFKSVALYCKPIMILAF